MHLFHFGKKKEEHEAEACCCRKENSSCEASRREPNEKPGSIQSVKVLGSGCKNCHALLVNTNTALQSMSIPFEAEYITDMEKIMAYGVMSMPALVVNEKVVSIGKVLTASEIEELLKKMGYGI